MSGHDDFRRTVWLEASPRGVKTVGYEPAKADLALLDREREARQVNLDARVEPVPAEAPADAADRRSSTACAVPRPCRWS